MEYQESQELFDDGRTESLTSSPIFLHEYEVIYIGAKFEGMSPVITDNINDARISFECRFFRSRFGPPGLLYGGPRLRWLSLMPILANSGPKNRGIKADKTQGLHGLWRAASGG